MLKNVIRYDLALIREISKKDVIGKFIMFLLFGFMMYLNENEIDFVIYMFSLLFTMLSFSLKKGMYFIPVSNEYIKKFIMINYIYKFIIFILIQVVIFLIEFIIIKNNLITILGMTFSVINFYLVINSPYMSISENKNDPLSEASTSVGFFVCIMSFIIWATDIGVFIPVYNIKMCIIILVTLGMFGVTIWNVSVKIKAVSNLTEYCG